MKVENRGEPSGIQMKLKSALLKIFGLLLHSHIELYANVWSLLFSNCCFVMVDCRPEKSSLQRSHKNKTITDRGYFENFEVVFEI